MFANILIHWNNLLKRISGDNLVMILIYMKGDRWIKHRLLLKKEVGIDKL